MTLVVLLPLTCGYLDPGVSKDYETCTEAYRKRRDSILDSGSVSIATCVLETLATWAATLLGCSGKTVYLVNEQYIVKPPRSASTSQFEWHRDSDYMDVALQQELTIACWIALDAVDEENHSQLHLFYLQGVLCLCLLNFSTKVQAMQVIPSDVCLCLSMPLDP
ncbi:hypothetical protein BDF14DRAFT_233618 [Spinellus fusiger]|nr:hypothetical protein BDF14DRAFT_233618 [Spinellus fusiger]